MITKFQIEHVDQHSNAEKCFDHKTTFLDMRRHFHLAIGISRKCLIACGGLEIQKNNLKHNMLGFAAYV